MSHRVGGYSGAGAAYPAQADRKRKNEQEHEFRAHDHQWIQDIHEIVLHGLEAQHEESFLEIYQTLHETTFLGLVSVKARLEELAAKLTDVPPLSFLILVQKQPRLKTYLLGIKEASLNFPFFLRGQSPWERTVYDFHAKFVEHKQGEVLGLAAFLEKLSEERRAQIQGFIEREQFRELLEYFVNN